MRQFGPGTLILFALVSGLVAVGCDSSSSDQLRTSTPLSTPRPTLPIRDPKDTFPDPGTPIAGFDTMQAELGWRLLRPAPEGFLLNDFNSWIVLGEDGELGVDLEYRIEVGQLEPHIAFMQRPMREMEGADLEAERVGDFDVYSFPPIATANASTPVHARFLTGETYDGKVIVGTLSGQAREVRDFIESLTFGE